MTINIGFQMDPLEGLSLEDDTTLAIIEECLSKNFNIWHFLPKDVSYINGEIMASSKIILELNRDIQPGFKTSDIIRKNLKELDLILEREKRSHLLTPVLKFLPTRVKLDLQGWDNLDIFSHS